MKKFLFFLIILTSCNGSGSKNNTVTKLGNEEFQFEKSLSSDLEKMSAAGKLKYDKSSRIYTLEDILNPKGKEKLTDEDYKILCRSYNFRNEMLEYFDQLKFWPKTKSEEALLTGKYRKIWQILSLFDSAQLLGKSNNAELTDGEIKVDTSY